MSDQDKAALAQQVVPEDNFTPIEDSPIWREVDLRKAISVMEDVLTDISDWEDKTLAEAVEESLCDLRSMLAAAPAAPECTRSHPHEDMNEACQRKTEEARAANAARQAEQHAESPQEPLTDEQLKVEWLGFNDPVDNPISLSDFECVARAIERTLATRWGVKLKGDT